MMMVLGGGEILLCGVCDACDVHGGGPLLRSKDTFLKMGLRALSIASSER